jgi:hypothetical protein
MIDEDGRTGVFYIYDCNTEGKYDKVMEGIPTT